MQISASKRIIDFNNAEIPSTGYGVFRASTDKSVEKLNLIKQVMLAIAEFNEDNWPEDEIWDTKLPEWYLDKIKSHSIEEIKRNTILWDYGSWLDAMKFRGWKWFSSQITSAEFKIFLEPYSFPFSVNPLEYVIWAAGVAENAIHYEDHATT